MKLDLGNLIEHLERKYKDQGYEPILYAPPPKEGCRACGDVMKGPWKVNVVTAKIDDRMEALIFPATLCTSCQESKEMQGEVASTIVGEYLKGLEEKLDR